MPNAIEIEAMSRACAAAREFMGATSPNPPVGAAALDAQDRLLHIEAHREAGQPHAEALLIEALRRQGRLKQAHTLCVTLEPCNHQGRTPPCVPAIIEAGFKRVVIGARDPNPHVAGHGVEALRAAGVKVAAGAAEDECRQLIHAFAHKMTTGRPFITIKRAFTRESSMIPPRGQRTFTSPESLKLAHQLRKKCDAILAGSGTVLADEPLYTVRYIQDHPHKRRLLGIMDRRRRVSYEFMRGAALRWYDATVYDDVHAAIDDLAARGVQDLLVEAGPALSGYLIEAGLWNVLVDIRQGTASDRWEARFNPAAPPPFDAKKFDWQFFLPP